MSDPNKLNLQTLGKMLEHAKSSQISSETSVNEKNKFYSSLRNSFIQEIKDDLALGKEIIEELKPVSINKKMIKRASKQLIHLPYMPSLHQPGWLLMYVLGPYNSEWFESIFSDVIAGITVAVTVIPQGLSYATLANVQPIQGLYAAILPSAVYVIYGSALQLSMGPGTIVSLLTGQLVAQYVPNYSDPEYYAQAAAVAAEVALAVGVTLTLMSLLNLGNVIRYISFPVLSGFTSGAACVTGLAQVKNAFGFSYPVPQQGETGYNYNYQVMQWLLSNWYERYSYTSSQLTEPTGDDATSNAILEWKTDVLKNNHLYRNKYATEICFSMFSVLTIIVILKRAIKETPERKKLWAFRFWGVFSAICPFIAVIIAAYFAWKIKCGDHHSDPNLEYEHNYDAHYLKIVGVLPSGLNFIQVPKILVGFDKILQSSVPVALIAYMESYSVSRKIATLRGELNILNPSLELWANGTANILASLSTAFPVCGSFSRSSINHACGARTPLSTIVTIIVVIFSLQYLTSAFAYIPTAALAAVIFAAIWNSISFTDLWEAWKNDKKDFFVILTTWVCVITFSTGFGLAAGLALSVIMLGVDMAFSDTNKPIIAKAAKDNNGIVVVRLRQDLNFLTCGRMREHIVPLFMTKITGNFVPGSFRGRIYKNVTSFMDKYFILKKPKFVDVLPIGIVIDFALVSTIDMSGMKAILDIQNDARCKGIKILITNCIFAVEKKLVKFGIKNDFGVNIEEYLNYGCTIPFRNNSLLSGSLDRDNSSSRDGQSSPGQYNDTSSESDRDLELLEANVERDLGDWGNQSDKNHYHGFIIGKDRLRSLTSV